MLLSRSALLAERDSIDSNELFGQLCRPLLAATQSRRPQPHSPV